MSPVAESLELSTDVLVVGGGPAATWAALTARSEGARVILVDKGMCGSSGVAPAATVGHWWVEPAQREQAIIERDQVGGQLSERSWMLALLEETWRRWPELGLTHGYPAGGIFRRMTSPGARLCQGPVYLREMRRRVSHSGVRILDHSPALELLLDADGAVAGAAGVQRQKGRPWRIRAGAVILATGGCAWKSGSLGSNVNTGDGYLMAGEVGVSLSGMEFSNYYGIVPKGSSMDKNGFNMVSTFYDADGNVVQSGWSGAAGASGGGGGLPGGPPAGGPAPGLPGGAVGTGQKAALIRAHLAGPVFQRLDLAPAEAREGMRAQMPNFFVTLDRLGIDPFRDRYEIEFVNEGTVRGTGGVHVVDDTCWTGVPGLWVAGDTASREAIVGGSSGAGAPNAAWTISSGTWSGRAAAAHAFARRLGNTGAGGHGDSARATSAQAFAGLTPSGQAGLRPAGWALPFGSWRELTEGVQAELNPPAKNGLRSAAKLERSLRELDALWQAACSGLIGADAREQLWARETAAMIASGRWAYLSAQARTESRAMHVREDFTEVDPRQRHRVLVHGVDDPQISFAEIEDPVVPDLHYAAKAA